MSSHDARHDNRTVETSNGLPGGRRLAASVAFLIIALALLAGRTGATVIRTLGFEAQCQGADQIFVGTVRDIASRPNAIAPRLFETVVTIAVEDVVAGSVPSAVELRLAGGELNGIRQSIDGMPEFAVGERYVVMTEHPQELPLVSPIIGFNQGLYRVEPESAPAGRLVVRTRSGQPLAPSAAGGAARATAGEPDLETFIGAIRVARGSSR